MNARLTTLTALIVAFATACTSAAPATPTAPGIELAAASVPRTAADAADALKAAQGMNAFGLDLYRRVATGTGNVVISPASVALALSMARPGARGETAAQMDTVLRAIASDDHAGWMNALEAALTARTGTFKDSGGKDSDVTLRIANAPFGQRGMTLVPAYLDALASRFGAGLRLVDFVADTEPARQLINLWTSDQTERRIPELLAKGILDQSTRL
ncbi:MAG TPA: serpin family protein, partial [Candidatus Limnocylindrales bacterium]